ncbi:MAG TPA: hypothetical protein PK379_13540 [Candidatus Hydrogenedentes bacterium]|nr:hypothetical protein [Candidatus Hydrogenedentota bacterium]HOK91042.1 hypothetical protein [Candidatus Hydrogenedentota bacterium]
MKELSTIVEGESAEAQANIAAGTGKVDRDIVVEGGESAPEPSRPAASRALPGMNRRNTDSPRQLARF